MKILFSALITTGCIAALAMASHAHAERADRNKPTVIDSDTLSHDEQRQVTVFTGNVVLTKGTLNLRGDRMELWQDDAGNYYGLVNGRPARFRQKREGVNEFIEGESLTLDYDGKTETVVLIGNAIMRRLEGDALKDQVSGDRLTYNNVTERYRVESGAEQARSRMFLMPGKEGSTPVGPTSK
jgi:lipopolysaccharide export system protein LptA